MFSHYKANEQLMPKQMGRSGLTVEKEWNIIAREWNDILWLHNTIVWNRNMNNTNQ